jgi:hypothetical protein
LIASIEGGGGAGDVGMAGGAALLGNRGEGGWRRKGELTGGPGLAARGEGKGRWEKVGRRGGWWAGRKEAGGVKLGHAGRKRKGEEGWVFFQTPFSFLFKPFQTQNFEIEFFFKLFKIFKTF